MERYEKKICLKKRDGLEVWKVEDQISMKMCIGKYVSKQAPPVLIHQFRMEEQLLSRLNSSWIPRLLDIREEETGWWLYEEFLEGETLEQWLQKHPSRQVRRWIFAQIVELIEFVHQAGFLYLDLKADNVLVCHHHACLIDFNSCLFLGSEDLALCNPDALPPEHQRGPLDERADQIGLGRLHQKMFGTSALSWTCLQEDPARRYASLQALKQAAAPWVSSRMVWSSLLLTSCMLLASTRFLQATPLETTALGSLPRQSESGYAAGPFHPILSDQEVSEKLEQALQSGSASRCIEVLGQIPEERLQRNPVLYGKVIEQAGFGQEEKWVDSLLQAWKQNPSFDQPQALVTFLFQEEPLLSFDQLETCHLLLERLAPDGSLALMVVQYALVLKSAGYFLEVPEALLQAACQEKTGQQLVELLLKSRL